MQGDAKDDVGDLGALVLALARVLAGAGAFAVALVQPVHLPLQLLVTISRLACVLAAGCRVQGAGCMVQGVWCRVYGVGCMV